MFSLILIFAGLVTLAAACEIWFIDHEGYKDSWKEEEDDDKW